MKKYNLYEARHSHCPLHLHTSVISYFLPGGYAPTVSSTICLPLHSSHFYSTADLLLLRCTSGLEAFLLFLQIQRRLYHKNLLLTIGCLSSHFRIQMFLQNFLSIFTKLLDILSELTDLIGKTLPLI